MNINKSLEEYLFEKNIYVRDEYFRSNDEKSEDEILSQLNLIAEFQKMLLKFNTTSYQGVNNIIGKELEKVKSAYIILSNLEDKDKSLYKSLIESIKEVLVLIDNLDFKDLIRRSQERKEISIGRLDEKNIRVLDEIEIGKIKKVSYNLIEEDVIDYLRRVRKVCKIENLDYLLFEYMRRAGLERDSHRYMKCMILAPKESIRYINKVKNNIDIHELEAAMISDGVINRGEY